MSLLITSNTPQNDPASSVVGLNRPFSYRNNLNGTFKIPAKSKIAVQSLKLNRSGEMTISESNDKFAMYFGELLADNEDNVDINSVPAPTSILKDGESTFTGNTDNVADRIELAGNNSLFHPNLCKNASTTLNPGFTCVPRRNASGLDFLGYTMTMTNTDSSKNASNISASWIPCLTDQADASYNPSTRVLTIPEEGAWIGSDFPLSQANGSFSASIVSTTIGMKFGLVRNQPDNQVDELMPPEYSAEDTEDFFDWCVEIPPGGGEISVFHTVPRANNLELVEVNYGAKADTTSGVDRITFNVQGERVKISAFNSGKGTTEVLVDGTSTTSASNCKPTSMTTRWLYPKIQVFGATTIGIHEFFGVDVDGFDYAGTNKGQDWWAYHFATIGDTSLAEDIDITFRRIAVDFTEQIGLNASGQIDYTMGMFFGKDERYLLTNSLNSVETFGFQGRAFVSDPNTTSGTSPYTQTFFSDQTPQLTARASLFVRLKNFTFDSVNFAKSSESKILYHVPSFDNSGRAVGSLYFEASQLVYLDLNNIHDLFISDIEVDIVYSDEKLATDLVAKTTVVFHIIQ